MSDDQPDLANPATPSTPTVVMPGNSIDKFPKLSGGFPGYPKTKHHPVLGAVTVADPSEEARLMPSTDWFDSAERADAARTYTEAALAQAHNARAKLAALDDQGLVPVRNSVTADQSVKSGTPEPL